MIVNELFDLFDDDSFIDDESILDDLLHQLDKYNDSILKKSKLQRFKILVKNIENCRVKVNEIIARFKNGSDDSETLRLLEREGLLSLKQGHRINEILKERRDLKKIVNVILSTKIGNGLEYLPTCVEDLKNALQMWMIELARTKTNEVKHKVEVVLDELLRRSVITLNQYNVIKETNNI